MFIKDGKRFNIHSAHEFNGTLYPAGYFRDFIERDRFGITEIPDPHRESTETHYVQEIDDAPYVINIPKSLADIQANRCAKINAERDARETQGFLYNGTLFDSDERSAARIFGAASAAVASILSEQPFSVDWTAADNTIVTLDAQGMLAMVSAFASHGKALHDAAKEQKSAVMAAETIEDVMAVAIWPEE